MTAPVSPGDREALAEAIRDAVRARYERTDAPYDAAWMMDGDTLDAQFTEGHVDLLAVADHLLARWRLVPVEPEPTRHWWVQVQIPEGFARIPAMDKVLICYRCGTPIGGPGPAVCPGTWHRAQTRRAKIAGTDYPDEDTDNPAWLREQIRKSAATLDGLPPEVREQLAHRTNQERT